MIITAVILNLTLTVQTVEIMVVMVLTGEKTPGVYKFWLDASKRTNVTRLSGERCSAGGSGRIDEKNLQNVPLNR